MSLESKGRLVDIAELNLKAPQKEITKKWMKFYKSIPPGKAFVAVDKELGVSHQTIRSKLKDFQRKGWAPKTLRISYRTRKDGAHDIIIFNEAKVVESKEATK